MLDIVRVASVVFSPSIFTDNVCWPLIINYLILFYFYLKKKIIITIYIADMLIMWLVIGWYLRLYPFKSRMFIASSLYSIGLFSFVLFPSHITLAEETCWIKATTYFVPASSAEIAMPSTSAIWRLFSALFRHSQKIVINSLTTWLNMSER